MAVNQIMGVPPQLLIRAIQQKLALQSFPDLKVGDKVEAQITQRLGDNRVVVLLNGSQLQAETTLPLQIGQKIQVQVETVQPQVLLRLASTTGEPTSTSPPNGLLKVLPDELPVFPPLKMGETLEAQVAQKLDGGKVVVMLKGNAVTVDTAVPLQVGQKIQIQVENLKPQLLLRLISVGNSENTPAVSIAGYLKTFRINPQAFAEMFQTGSPLLAPDTLNMLPNGPLRDRSQALGQMFRTLIFSKETIGNPMFIQDFVNRSGLVLERTLGRMVQEGIPDKITGPAGGDNLKSALLKLGTEIREYLAAKPDLQRDETARLLQLADYADRSVHTLETQQALNVMSRDQDNRFMIQIPFAFPQSLTLQDIFIEFDGKRPEEREQGAPFRAVLFLNLDTLGKMMVEVGISGEDLTADLSCQSVDTLSVVAAHLDDLKGNLASLGFRIMRMTCELREDIAPVRDDYIRNSSWYDGDVVNFFA